MLIPNSKEAESSLRAKGLPLRWLPWFTLPFKMKRTGFILIINLTVGYF